MLGNRQLGIGSVPTMFAGGAEPMLVLPSNTAANRPTAGSQYLGMFYLATNTGEFSRCVNTTTSTTTLPNSGSAYVWQSVNFITVLPIVSPASTAFCFGPSCTNTSSVATAMGYGCTIGTNAYNSSTAMGHGCTIAASVSNSVSMGSLCSCTTNYDAVAMGYSCTTSGQDAVSVGSLVVNPTTSSFDFGYSATAKVRFSGLKLLLSTTATNSANVPQNTVNMASGPVSATVSTTSNATTTETDGYAYTIPANAFITANQSLDYIAAGTFAATINNKRLRVYLDDTLLFDSTALASTGAASWEVRATIIAAGSTAQRCTVSVVSSEPLLEAKGCTYTLGAEDMTSAKVLKITMTGTANADITCEMGRVKWNGAP